MPVFHEKEDEGGEDGESREVKREAEAKRRYVMYASEDVNVRVYYFIKLRISEEERKANSG